MAKRILKCEVCKNYTIKETHCNKRTINPKPAKFSIEDKYQKYRLDYKQKFK